MENKCCDWKCKYTLKAFIYAGLCFIMEMLGNVNNSLEIRGCGAGSRA